MSASSNPADEGLVAIARLTKRLTTIEESLTHLDRLVESLSSVVNEHRLRLDLIEARLAKMSDRAMERFAPDHEPPADESNGES